MTRENDDACAFRRVGKGASSRRAHHGVAIYANALVGTLASAFAGASFAHPTPTAEYGFQVRRSRGAPE